MSRIAGFITTGLFALGITATFHFGWLAVLVFGAMTYYSIKAQSNPYHDMLRSKGIDPETRH